MPISKISFIRSTVVAILIGLAALLGIVGVNLWLVGQTEDYSNTVTSARQLRSALVDLRGLLDDAETGQRGYLLTGNKDYLQPYQHSIENIGALESRLRDLLNADTAQQAKSARLIAIVPQKMAELAHTIELFDAGRRDEAFAAVNGNLGRNLMDEARGIFSELLSMTESKISTAVRDEDRSINALWWVTVIGALVIIIVVGSSVWLVLLYTTQLVAAQREVMVLNTGLEERVRERTADLGRANDEIQRFAYIVTHDLRAPLVNIMGFTSELEGSLGAIQKFVGEADPASEEPVTREAREAALEDLPEAIGFIRSSTRKMDGLINAILKLSREGRRVLRPEPIDLEALFKATAANVQHQVAEANGEISIAEKAPQVFSDRLALEQIFGNLLDNAVKYRDPKRPIEISVKSKAAAGQRVLIEVKDNGRGIAPQDHERVFDLFRRSGAQDQAGEGIGLAHVRTMVRNLGGDITLASTFGEGTTMTVNLPRDLRVVLAAQNKGAA